MGATTCHPRQCLKNVYYNKAAMILGPILSHGGAKKHNRGPHVEVEDVVEKKRNNLSQER